MYYFIGQIQVRDNNHNGQFDPGLDRILGENDEELQTDDWELKRTLGQIGMRQLQDLPLSMASELHQHYSKLIAIEKVLDAQPTVLQKYLDSWRKEVSIQISNLKEYAHLQIGMRAYCTVPETVANFHAAAQEKASEMQKGPLGFSIDESRNRDFEDLYELAILNGLENFFTKAEGASQFGDVEETRELLYQAYDFAMDHGLEYDEAREAGILEDANVNQSWRESVQRLHFQKMAESLLKATNPADYQKYRQRLLEEQLKQQRNQSPK